VEDKRNQYRFCVWKCEEKMSLEGPRRRWE
jgi:hypothetical protein